jgi:hypothetical protein
MSDSNDERHRLARRAVAILEPHRPGVEPFRGTLGEAVDALVEYAMDDCPGGKMPNRSDLETRLTLAATGAPARVAQLFAAALLQLGQATAKSDVPAVQASTDVQIPTAPAGYDDCSVEPGETHRYAHCPGARRASARAAAAEVDRG